MCWYSANRLVKLSPRFYLTTGFENKYAGHTSFFCGNSARGFKMSIKSLCEINGCRAGVKHFTGRILECLLKRFFVS